jgi:hypothetical protein
MLRKGASVAKKKTPPDVPSPIPSEADPSLFGAIFPVHPCHVAWVSILLDLSWSCEGWVHVPCGWVLVSEEAGLRENYLLSMEVFRKNVRVEKKLRNKKKYLIYIGIHNYFPKMSFITDVYWGNSKLPINFSKK